MTIKERNLMSDKKKFESLMVNPKVKSHFKNTLMVASPKSNHSDFIEELLKSYIKNELTDEQQNAIATFMQIMHEDD